MTQPPSTSPRPPDQAASPSTRRPAMAVGNVPFTLVLLAAILTLLPWTRPGGIALLVLLAIPAVVVWLRARKLRDGSRGLTTSTLAIWGGAFVLGAALSPSSTAPVAPAPAYGTATPVASESPFTSTPAPMSTSASPPATTPALATIPAQRPFVPAPPRPAAPAPRVVHTPRVAPAPAVTREQAPRAAYYKNCAAARAAGAAPLHAGEPGYRAALDRDNDGVACE